MDDVIWEQPLTLEIGMKIFSQVAESLRLVLVQRAGHPPDCSTLRRTRQRDTRTGHSQTTKKVAAMLEMSSSLILTFEMQEFMSWSW